MGKRVLKSSLIDAKDVFAFFTTRDLPLKYGEREDLKEQIEENKKLVCKGLKIPLENLIIPQQTHSDNIGLIPFTLHPSLFTCENTDALITNQPNIALALNFADCVPLIFYDPMQKVVAAAHAGWRGTEAQIGVKTVKKMVEEFCCNPKDITVLIGPAIGKCCFEVQEDVQNKLLNTINKEYYSKVCKNNNLDLKFINKFQLLANGVEKIDVCEYCTSCQNELFFSYRKEKGKCLRHSAVIMLREKK